MFKVFRDSLFDPKKIITYQNKSGWFVTFYILILALLMSTGSIIYYAKYDNNSTITTATTGCSISNSKLVCNDASHDPSKSYTIYGFTFYFLDSTENVSEISLMESDVMVFQNDTISIYQSHSLYFSWSIEPMLSQSIDFDQMMSTFESALLFVAIVMNFGSNIAVMVFFVLISSLPFLSLRKFFKYKNIFKLVTFATTPIAALLTFYGLIPMSDFIFILLLFGSYYTLMILRRSMMAQIFLNLQAAQKLMSENQPIIDALDIDNLEDDTEVEEEPDDTKED